MCGCRNHGVIILIKLTNFHPFYIMNLILSNQKTSRCVFKMMKKRSVIVPGRRNARESARGYGKEGSLVPVPYGARESVGCRRENLGTRLKCSVCRRLLLPLLHAEKGRRPFSACNTGNRIRLHAGKSSTKFCRWNRDTFKMALENHMVRAITFRGIIGKLQKIWTVIWTDQRAKKVVSDSPGLVDFAIGLVNSVLNLSDGQVKYFEEFNLQKNFEINSAHHKILGASWNDVWASKC